MVCQTTREKSMNFRQRLELIEKLYTNLDKLKTVLPFTDNSTEIKTTPSN